MNHQIMHLNGTVLFEAEIPDETPFDLATRVTLVAAVRDKANLRGANLRGASLSNANLSYADLGYADLGYANLNSANLRFADLRFADLGDASLINASLSNANLCGAYLRFADLRYSNLGVANLINADLSGANLGGAYLGGANLSDANLSDANLSGTRLIGQRPILQIGPIGSRSDFLLAFITDQGLRLQAGCFFGTRVEFEAKLDAEHGDNEHAREYRAALALIDAHAAIWTPDTGALQ